MMFISQFVSLPMYSKFIINKQLEMISYYHILAIKNLSSKLKIFFSIKNFSNSETLGKQFCCQYLKINNKNSPFLFQRKMSEIRSNPSYNFLSFSTSEEEEEEEAFFKSLLEECISLRLKVKTTTKRALVRMSQSKHPLEYVQEYVRMAREATIDKENLDYLNHHETFYICDMTDNLQYWIIIVEKESFVVCCENGGLPSHNILSSLQFFEITHHNIAPNCKNESENRYLEKFWNGLVFFKEKGKYCFKDGSIILLIFFLY
ncbi:hypothetical protein RFI_13613 [Reticulomyxa filosa]|uniref:Uncharacterized protein n=1 Tax=Reticulomyxa filosa TaxID=46433 RepID=X6NBA1_RETFI|nr:hypothetical protein RFI_13613 [Reticulomyxa filosa]|eukprot:ETO23565.1 hypothetical protein RFI_13613 [Reticulomyxa filosa]